MAGFPYMAPAIALTKFDFYVENEPLLMSKMSPILRTKRNETSHMLFIWILVSKNVVDDFECFTDKRERFYDPMDPGL